MRGLQTTAVQASFYRSPANQFELSAAVPGHEDLPPKTSSQCRLADKLFGGRSLILSLARGLQSCAPSAPAPSVVPYGRGLILAAPFLSGTNAPLQRLNKNSVAELRCIRSGFGS